MARTPTKRTSTAEQAKRPVPRSASRRKRERRREEALRAISGGRRSSRPWLWTGIAGGVIVLAVVLIVVLTRGSTPAPQPAPSTPTAAITPNPAQLAAAGNPSGQAIGGIQCQTGEQLTYHIHAHLAIYVNGVAKVVPEGIGITPPRQEVVSDAGPYVNGGTCFYWLHTHTADGVIHIESPTTRQYTLGQFFDIWGQQLSANQVGPATGKLFVYVNGTAFTGDPRTITLTEHELIQIDEGTNTPPQPFTFPPGL